MQYKYTKELKEGSVVHYMGIPVTLLNDTFIGTNTNLEAVALGSITSDKKAKSSKENGKKGGRPKKV